LKTSALLRNGLPVLAIGAALILLALSDIVPSFDTPAGELTPGPRTAHAALTGVSPDMEAHMRSMYERLDLDYPPKAVTLIAFKYERVLELWAETDGGPVLIKRYRFCAASGTLGPKLRRGDMQVPEGIYNVVNLNDKSRFHLSLLIDYPNRFDKEMADLDGRSDLGSEICIHGGCVSAGCIALGDDAIEEIFQVACDAGMQNCRAIIAPYDFRKQGLPSRDRELRGPSWVRKLYIRLDNELKSYPEPA